MTEEKRNVTPITDEKMEAVSGGGVLICNISAGKTFVAPDTDCFTGGWDSIESRYGGLHLPREDHKELRAEWAKVCSERVCGNCNHLEFNEAGQGYCGQS